MIHIKSMAEKSDDEKIIRKLRKKLRQIETLEYSDRELNDEECIKIRYLLNSWPTKAGSSVYFQKIFFRFQFIK